MITTGPLPVTQPGLTGWDSSTVTEDSSNLTGLLFYSFYFYGPGLEVRCSFYGEQHIILDIEDGN